MSDTILGVIVGAVIASIAPLSMLYINHLHWKQEAKLNRFKDERARLESLLEKTLTSLSKAIAENSYPAEMIADIITFMPGEVTTKFNEFILDPDKTELKRKVAYLELVKQMKSRVAAIDKQICDLLK